MKTELKKFFTENPKGQKIVLALCYTYNYQEEIVDEQGNLIPNPISKEDFCSDVVLNFLKDNYKRYIHDIKRDEARVGAEQQVSIDMDGF